MIVDDEPHNRQLLEAMLAPEGYCLQNAVNGEEALALVAHHPPDLILLDIKMPGMDGYEVAGRIKNDLSTRHIPLIIITALDDRDARLRGLHAGAEDVLTKPVDRAELVVRVRNLLRLKAHGDSLDAYSHRLQGEVGSRRADLVESEAHFRQRERLLTMTLSSISDFAYIYDRDGRFLFVNQPLLDLWGIPLEQAVSAIPMR